MTLSGSPDAAASTAHDVHVTIDLGSSGAPIDADRSSVAASSDGADDADKPRSDAEKVCPRAPRAPHRCGATPFASRA